MEKKTTKVVFEIHLYDSSYTDTEIAEKIQYGMNSYTFISNFMLGLLRIAKASTYELIKLEITED